MLVNVGRLGQFALEVSLLDGGQDTAAPFDLGENLLGAVFMLIAAVFGLVGAVSGTERLPGIVMAVCFGLLGALYLAAGIGLWQLKGFGRRIQIAFAIIGLLGIPIGTLISALLLYYLTRPGIKLLFSGRSPAELDEAERAEVEKASGGGVVVVVVVVVVLGLVVVGAGIIAAGNRSEAVKKLICSASGGLKTDFLR